MKKIAIIGTLLLFGAAFTLNSCRKPPKPDPCENVECPPGQKCVKGKCVDMRPG